MEVKKKMKLSLNFQEIEAILFQTPILSPEDFDVPRRGLALGTLGLGPFPEQKKSRSKIAYGDQRATISEQLEVP